jgi:hypothetical protein
VTRGVWLACQAYWWMALPTGFPPNARPCIVRTTYEGIMLTASQQAIVDLVVKRAEEACRQALAQQTLEDDLSAEYKSGWIVAVAVCEGSIRRAVERHIEQDLRDAKVDAA